MFSFYTTLRKSYQDSHTLNYTHTLRVSDVIRVPKIVVWSVFVAASFLLYLLDIGTVVVVCRYYKLTIASTL